MNYFERKKNKLIESFEALKKIGRTQKRKLRIWYKISKTRATLHFRKRVFLTRKKAGLSFSNMVRKKGFKKAVLVFLVLILIISNPFKSSLGKSIHQQEFFINHVNDLLGHIKGNILTADNSLHYTPPLYENQIFENHFGLAKGRNLILVQMESMQNMLINAEYEGQEITPFLNSLIKSEGTFYFDNFYSQLGAGNTSDAEFAVNHSMLGTTDSYTYQLFQNNYFKGLPKILKEENYCTAAFHGYKKNFWNRENIYPNLGFDFFFGGEDYVSDNIEGLGGGNITGISDSEFFRQTVEKMKELKEPYYSFLITLSAHHPFGLPDEMKEIDLLAKDENVFGNYLNAIHYSDKALSEFFDELKESGLYKNSLIILYGDHFGLSKSDPRISNLVTDWLGTDYTYDEMNNVPLIIHIPGEKRHELFSVSGGQIDLLPTISYLMGIRKLDTLYLGQNLFNLDTGFVPLQMHMLKGSFIMNDIVFEMSRDGIFENSKAWNRLTKEEVSVKGYYKEYKKAKAVVETSSYFLYNDVAGRVFLKGEKLRDLMGIDSSRVVLPKALKIFTFKENSLEELAQLNEILTESSDLMIGVSSDKLYEILAEFEHLYSGKKGDIGSIFYVDDNINAEFIEKRNRIVLLMEESTADFPKLEYLGYQTFLLDPNISGMSERNLELFVDSNNLSGIIVRNDKWDDYKSLVKKMNLAVYKKEEGDFLLLERGR